jgi:cytochrome P450
MRNVVRGALIEAARDGKASATPRDLVRAFAFEPACSAAQVLKRLNAFEATETPTAQPADAISPETMKVVEQAYEESALLKDRLVGTDHLLLALLKLNEAPELQGKGVSYDCAMRELKRLRSWGLGPDFPPPQGRVGPHVALAKRVKKAVGNAVKAYKVYGQLSAMHPKLVTDPYPMYRRLRAKGIVRRDPLLPAFVVTGYAEVSQVLRDPRFSSEPRSNRTKSGTMEVDFLPAGPVRKDLCVIANVLTKQMVFMDPPNHSRVRNQMAQMFSPRNVNTMRDRVQEIADYLIDEVGASGRMDLVEDYAYPLPLLVVAEIMGFRREDKVMLKRWSDVFATMLAFSTTMREDLHARQCMIEMRRYFDEIVAELQARPNASLLSQLITPKDGSPPIDLDELFGNCVFLLAAGHETTTSVLANGVRALLNDERQLKMLMDDPALMVNAVEELLRYESPVHWTSRRAKEDLELGGVQIPKNSMVMISMGAGNRDERQYPDPDRLDITRANAKTNLAFSGGNHYCLGAQLARIELQVGLATLLKRCRNLRIQPGFEVTWRPGTTLHSFESLPVLFDSEEKARQAEERLAV